MSIDHEQLDPERQLSEETPALYYPLRERLGEDTARKAIAALIETVGGERYYINAPNAIVLEQAVAAATSLLESGHTIGEVARQTGLRRSKVDKLQKELRT